MTQPGVIRIDDLGHPRLPRPLRAANALGAALAPRLVALEPAALLEAACRKTGLRDFGADDFREPLAVLLGALRREAGLSALGYVTSRAMLVQLLVNRLRLEALIRQHPEIEAERITRPLVIAGLPRTGTTHLHNLISQDTALRSLPYWESLEPFPNPREMPPRKSWQEGRDPRVLRCERGLRFQDWVMPHFKRMHEMSPQARHEEIHLLAMAFSTMLFESAWPVPSYAAWYKSHDQSFAYRYLERVLKALQWLRGPKRWVLKSPQHLEQIQPLLEVFPDARFVQTHRDPLRITASLCTMITYGTRMQARHVDAHKLGRYWAARSEDLLRASVTQRAHLSEEQTFDVHFQEFMKDDLAMVERVLAFADHPLSDEARAAMQKFLAENPRGKHGSVEYVLEDVGVDPAERRRALRFYVERFGVAEE